MRYMEALASCNAEEVSCAGVVVGAACACWRIFAVSSCPPGCCCPADASTAAPVRYTESERGIASGGAAAEPGARKLPTSCVWCGIDGGEAGGGAAAEPGARKLPTSCVCCGIRGDAAEGGAAAEAGRAKGTKLPASCVWCGIDGASLLVDWYIEFERGIVRTGAAEGTTNASICPPVRYIESERGMVTGVGKPWGAAATWGVAATMESARGSAGIATLAEPGTASAPALCCCFLAVRALAVSKMSGMSPGGGTAIGGTRGFWAASVRHGFGTQRACKSCMGSTGAATGAAAGALYPSWRGFGTHRLWSSAFCASVVPPSEACMPARVCCAPPDTSPGLD